MTEAVEDPTPIEIEVVPDQSPATDIAKEVLAGHWGRGRVRDQRLKDAGYDVAEVNKEVFKALSR